MNLTIDASVFVAAARIEEPHYSVSRQFLLQVPNAVTAIFCPILILPECAAAIARPTADATLAEELVTLVAGFPKMQIIPLDLPVARRAVDIATRHRLRGADAVYMAVAEAFNTQVITWDEEMLNRGSGVAETMTPARWLETEAEVK